ncbi:MAG: TIGR03545 family protein [Bacteroidota bacterium]
MRKKFVFIVLVPLILFLVVTYLFIDTWIESGLEAAGEAAVGARVEIDDLRVTLMPVGIEFARLQVANPSDPWKNLFETGHARFAVDFGQLLRGKYIVETVEVNDLIFGTQRATDGSLPKKPEETGPSLFDQVASKVTERARTTPIFDLDQLRRQFNVDSILNVQELRSLRHIDSLKASLEHAGTQWTETLGDVEQTKHRLAQIESSVKSINVNELKTIENLLAAATTIENASKAVAEINETFKARRASVTGDITALSTAVTTIDDVVKEDYNRLVRLARLPDVSMGGMAELLLGKELFEEGMKYLSYIDYARSALSSSESDGYKHANPPRFEGQTIHFAVERGYPKWWVQKVLVSGGTDRAQDPEYYYAKGELKNIASDQRVTGHPMTVALSATKGERTTATIGADFDRRGEIPTDTYKADVTGVVVGQFSLGRSEFLPSRIIDSRARIAVDVVVPGNRFDSNLRIVFSDMNLMFDRQPRNTVERLVREVLELIRGFNATLRIWNTDEKLQVAFATDLDDQIAARTKRVIGEEVARLQAEIRSKLNARIATERAHYEKLFNDKKEAALNRLREYEQIVNRNVALVDTKKKEVEARIEEEKKKQTDEAKKKLEEQMKGIFRRQ